MTPAVRPPFDPEIEAALRDPASQVVTALAPHEIEPLRALDPQPDEDSLTRGGQFGVSTHRIKGSGGDPDLTLWIWRPVGATGPMPVLYHLHGGGLVVGTAVADVPPVLDLAAEHGCMVASIGYRLAPEWRYPAAVEDCYTGLRWLSERAADLGIDPGRIIIGGVSAGGGLAAATTLLARSRGGPTIAAQLLVCPMLDDRNNTTSAKQMAGEGAWDREANATGWGAYLGDAVGGADVPESAAPARAKDLTGLPPAFLDVGSAETFRDEVLAYASHLWECGGDAELHVWPGGCHGFDGLAPHAVLSRQARAARAAWLGRVLSPLYRTQ